MVDCRKARDTNSPHVQEFAKGTHRRIYGPAPIRVLPRARTWRERSRCRPEVGISNGVTMRSTAPPRSRPGLLLSLDNPLSHPPARPDKIPGTR